MKYNSAKTAYVINTSFKLYLLLIAINTMIAAWSRNIISATEFARDSSANTKSPKIHNVTRQQGHP